MKISWKISIVSLLCFFSAKTLPDFTYMQNNEGILLQGARLSELLHGLSDATEKFLERVPDESAWPMVICTTCKTGKFSIGGLSGSIAGKTIQDMIDGKNSFDEMKMIAEEFIHLLLGGTLPELARFLLETSNSIQCPCSCCKGMVWQLKE